MRADLVARGRDLEAAREQLAEHKGRAHAAEQRRAQHTDVSQSVSKLMTENVALLDEVLETRSKYQALARKLQKTESRAVQAEAANETLATLLTWRDTQINGLLKGGKDAAPGSPKSPAATPDLAKLEAQIKDLKPYMAQLSSHMDARLASFASETKE